MAVFRNYVSNAMNTLTTSPSQRPFRQCAALFGTLLLAAAPATADDTSKFEAADADSSGTLTLEEFKSLLPPKIPRKQVVKRFNRADSDKDSLVSLDEWLAYRQDLKEEAEERKKQTARFNDADRDADGFLTYAEFIPLIPGKRPLIEVRRRFLQADVDKDSLVSLNEWLDLKMGNLADTPMKKSKFALADLDGDGLLTPEEFTTTYPRKTPAATILRKFNKEDENDDGLLSRDEWAPGDGKPA